MNKKAEIYYIRQGPDLSVIEMKNKTSHFLLEIKYNRALCSIDLCGKAVASFK